MNRRLTPASGDINAASRTRSLATLRDTEVDVLVIGGGVTGAGVALDAITRGMSVALVEARDLASGTSGASSKLVHGGLRYLASGDLGLAWESAVERRALMRTIAPHLTRPEPFLVPRYGTGGRKPDWGALLTETGIRLADLLRSASGLPSSILPRPRRVSATQATELVPGLRQAGLRGGIVYWDGALEDDTRLVLALARTAAAHGAHIITRCRVTRATDRDAWLVDEWAPGQAQPGARGSGATPQPVRVRARSVINAAGVWAEEFTPGLGLAPSRGTHLVVPADRCGFPRAVLTVAVPGEFGRFVFVLPQPDGLCYLGLTDEAAPGADGYAPGVPTSDIEFLLRTVNTALETRLTADDVLSSFSGLRPLIPRQSRARRRAGVPPTVAAAPSASAKTSRRHLVTAPPGRPITVTGGKLTIYRRMAEEAVDLALERLGKRPGDLPSRTRALALIGAANGGGDDATVGSALAAASHTDATSGGAATSGSALAAATGARLVRTYGGEASRIIDLAAREPALARAIAPRADVLGAEVWFACVAEGALTADDVLARRTRLALEPALAAAARPAIERLLLAAARA